MSEFKLTTVEEFEAATNRLLETGAKVGADAWQFRVKNQTPHCKFGEQGICCRIWFHGTMSYSPKAPRGICGCDAHGIVGRNFLRFTAGGAATHSDHGREICITLGHAKEGGDYQVKDPEKLIRIAKEWGVETEAKTSTILLMRCLTWLRKNTERSEAFPDGLREHLSIHRICGTKQESSQEQSTVRFPVHYI